MIELITANDLANLTTSWLRVCVCTTLVPPRYPLSHLRRCPNVPFYGRLTERHDKKQATVLF